MATALYILFNSLFTNHPNIKCNTISVTVLLNKQGKQTMIFLGRANRTWHNITACIDISFSVFLNQ